MNLSVKGKLRRAVRDAFAVGVASAVAVPGLALAQETEEDAVELDRVEITGSRLKRADVEGALPVTVINREQIDLSGDISVADLLRNMSFNTFGSFRQQSGTSWQSVATIDLRGLGAERTLVLINGRRAPKHPSTGSVQDLNVVPLAAVERIEVLQDGASAVYGSDAIGGVVNIILRDDFEGVEVMYGEGRPSSIDGGDTTEGSMIMGVNGAKGNLVIGASFTKRDIIYTRDMIYGYQPGASVYGNNYYGMDSGFFGAIPGGCEEPNFNYNPETDQCLYDFAIVAADEASTETMSLFANGRYEINDDWSFVSTATISRAESFGRYAPVPDYFFVPGDADSNPFGEDIYVYHRFAALGNRDNDVEGNNYDILGGFEGRWGMFDIDVGARWSEFRVYDIGRNYTVRPIVMQYAAEGLYDFVHPSDNPPEVLNAMKATISRISTWETEEYWGNVSFDVAQMAGGMAAVAVGAEYRSEDYSDQYDSLSEAGAIGGSAGNSAGGGRDMRALFAEGVLPVLENLEVSLALRYDDYSDYGNDTSPKIALRYQPLDMLTLRASYGEGFRAPTLDILTMAPSFSAEPITNDQPTCEFFGYDFVNGTCRNADGQIQSIQVDSTIISNPELSSETSKQYTFGLAADPTPWLNFTVDYYNIEIEDLIAYIGPAEILTRLEAGDPIPGGLGVERNPDQGNRISNVTAGYANEGTLETDGIDLSAETNFRLGAFGRLRNELLATYVLGYSFDDGRDLVGDPGTPDMRATLYNTWFISDFAVAYNLNYIADQAETVSDGERSGHIGSWITHDLQVNYETPWNGRVTLGVNNVGDKEPPLVAYGGRPYNFDLYDAYGRTPYFRYTQRF